MSSESNDPESDSICDQPNALVSNTDVDGMAVALASEFSPTTRSFSRTLTQCFWFQML